MGLMAQVINLVLKISGFAILLALQESTVSGNGIAPSPSQVIFGSVSPTREGILPPAPHGMQLRRDSPSPASQPNVSPLHLAQAPVSTKGLAPLLSPITSTLPPNSSAAPPTNVQNIAPASSPSASHGKTPQMEGPKLVPENPEPVGTPLIKAPHNPPTTQPVLPGSVPSISPQIKAPDNRSPLSEAITPEPAASPPDNLLTDSSPIHPTVPGVPQLNLPVPAASPTSNLPSYSPPLYPLVPEVSPSKLPAPDVTPISTPPPSFNSKGDGMPVAAPLSGMHKQVSPPDSPKEGPGQLFPRGSTNAPRPLSRINSPPHEELHPPTLLPSVPIYKRDHPGNKFTSHAPVSSPVHPPALTDKEHGVAPISARPPSFDWKRNAMPVAAPPNVVPEQLSPLDYSPLEAPMHNSLRPLSVMEFPPHAAPPPGFDQKKDGIKVVVPSNETPKQSLPQHHSPIGAPMQNSHRVFAYTPLPSVIKSPPHKWVQPATPLTSTPYYKHRHAKKNISSSRPSSYLVPSASTNKVIAAPPLDPPEVNSDSRHKSHAPPILNPVASSNSAFTSAERPLSPVSKTQIAPSQQMTIPHSPPQNSPSWSSSISNPKVPHLPHIQALPSPPPPPPPNEECASLSCREPFTYNLPGSPCGCVLAMQVGLRLSLALYTFFPLVSELAAEISRGVLMNQSQVLIMGANADSEDQVKTIVLIDLVPLAPKFDNSTAYLIYQRFRNKQVAIKPDHFGNYEVLYLRYPGLPASPPARSTFDGEAYSGQMNKGMPLKPLGVDVSRQQHKKGLKGSVIAIIVLLASVSLILCGAVVWVLLFRHRDGNAQPEHTPTTILPSLAKSAGVSPSKIGSGINSISPSYNSDLGPYTGAAKTFSSIDIERATDSFDASNVIGEGGFGLVYSGVLDDGTKVAVKVLKRDNQQGGREFLAEVEMLSRLHHRNLVKLIGICTEEHARCLVYELIPNGSVDSHLHGVDKEDAALDWNSRLKIALGAARGLAYLHEDSSPRVIHRDFKSSNILLEHDFTPKVSDFGLARTASEEANKHISTRVMGTFGYVAPEYAMTGHLLVKSDVYSYGVVLLELLTGRKPVDMSRPPGQENLVTWARSLLTSIEGLELMTDQTLGPDFPFDSIAQVAAIASMCVQPEVSDRPFMSEVIQALKLICTEYYVKNNFESRICSQEHIPVDFDEGYSTSSGRIPYHLQTQSSVSDVEWGLQVSEAFSVSARFSTLNSSSFGRHSSPGPRRSGRAPPLWTKNGGWSGGSKSEHGVSFRLWPVPH